MAARKKAARKKKASSGDGGSLWAPKLGLVALRVFVGLVFLSVSLDQRAVGGQESVPFRDQEYPTGVERRGR